MRTLDSAIAAASQATSCRRIYFARLEFDAGTVAWHSGYGDLTLDSIVYRGLGMIGSIAAVNEQPGVKSQALSMEVCGLKPEVVSLIQQEPYVNRKAYIHCTFLDDQDRPLVATPLLLFKGSIDEITASIGKRASVTITLKSRLADWERQRVLRYTDADQQKLYPGDRAFEFVPQLSQRKLIWPKAAFLPDPRD